MMPSGIQGEVACILNPTLAHGEQKWLKVGFGPTIADRSGSTAPSSIQQAIHPLGVEAAEVATGAAMPPEMALSLMLYVMF